MNFELICQYPISDRIAQYFCVYGILLCLDNVAMVTIFVLNAVNHCCKFKPNLLTFFAKDLISKGR